MYEETQIHFYVCKNMSIDLANNAGNLQNSNNILQLLYMSISTGSFIAQM